MSCVLLASLPFFQKGARPGKKEEEEEEEEEEGAFGITCQCSLGDDAEKKTVIHVVELYVLVCLHKAPLLRSCLGSERECIY